MNWGDGKAYFFKGLLYASYDLKDNRITPGHPLPIALYWPGMFEAGYTTSVRAPVDLVDTAN